MGLAFAAGLLSTLSPCVLPVLPLVLGPALAAHRLGVPALVAGLVLSFTGIGLFVATVGFSIGLDGDVFRDVSAVLLAGLGIVLLSSAIQRRFAMATAGVSDAGSRLIDRLTPTGLQGQFVVGVLLGAVWSPCVGPTLGAASVLAARGQDLPGVATVMAAFGLGTSGSPARSGGAVAGRNGAMAGQNDERWTSGQAPDGRERGPQFPSSS